MKIISDIDPAVRENNVTNPGGHKAVGFLYANSSFISFPVILCMCDVDLTVNRFSNVLLVFPVTVDLVLQTDLLHMPP